MYRSIDFGSVLEVLTAFTVAVISALQTLDVALTVSLVALTLFAITGYLLLKVLLSGFDLLIR